tara:strand:- start:763 stop:1158 length:396 start_codon:yes stop_codon:yes gene_type:complete
MAKKKMSPLDKVAKRYKITAREARDIATAVGTLGRAVVDKNVIGIKGRSGTKGKVEASVRGVVKQVRETGRAAATGKMGTTAAKIKTDMRDDYGNPRGGEFKSARKRLTEKQQTARSRGKVIKGTKNTTTR